MAGRVPEVERHRLVPVARAEAVPFLLVGAGMISLGLLIASLVLFILAALPWPPLGTYHPNLIAAGLACMVASQLATGK